MGAPVVVLASMLVMARSYRRLMRVLCPRRRVLVLELPGCGRSSRVARALPIREHAQIAAGFAERLGLPSCNWIGHSNSGPVALALAALHPERVSRLVLADPVGGLARDSLVRILFARAWDALREPRLTVSGTFDVLYNLVRHRRAFVDQVRFVANPSLETIPFERLAVPTVLAWGIRDHTEPPEALMRMLKMLPGAELVLGRGSHDWLIEHATEFTEAIGRAEHSLG